MPYSKVDGRSVYVQNTQTSAAIQHGQPTNEGVFVGVAVKQVGVSFDSKIADATVIADDEKYLMIVKGIVQVPTVSGFAKGDRVYITTATNVLTEASGAGTKPYGTVVEIAGERGCPAGKCRIDLDLKADLDVS